MSAEHVTVLAAESVAPRRERIAGGAVMRTRVAAALGLLSVILSVVGFVIHGYPAIGASGKEIARWAATTNQQQFAIGLYFEALGYLLFLLFAAWIWTVGRDAEGGSGWLSTAGFGAAVLYVGSIIDNGIWWAILDAGRRGTNPQTLAAIRDIAQHIFETTLLFGGVFFVLIGYVLFRTRALPRWIGATAVVVGLILLIPPAQMVGGAFVFIWPAAVSLYLLVRPGAAATVREPSVTRVSSTAAGTS
jgi:Domain of unknown function (DUF4386)